MASVEKIGLSLPRTVYSALQRLAASRGQTTNECIRHELTNAVQNSGFLSADELAEMELYRNLSLRVADTAAEIVTELGFCPPDITPRAVARCQSDPLWFADYERYVGGDPFAVGNERKHNLNPNLGYQVKKRLGAVNCVKPNGKDQVLKAVGLVIRNYTALRVE